MTMAKKEYPPWHYFVAAALALVIGVTYTFYLFQLVLGPGALVVGTSLIVVGIRKQRKKSAGLAANEAPRLS